MNQSLLKKAAIQSVALMITVVTLSFALNQYQTVSIFASSMSDHNSTGAKATSDSMDDGTGQADDMLQLQQESLDSTDATAVSAGDFKSRIDKQIMNKLSNNFLVIKKPEGDKLSLQLNDLYINQSIQLDISGLTNDNINSKMVLRLKGNEMFVGDPKFTEITTLETDDKSGTTENIVTKDFGGDISHGITISTKEDAVTGLYQAQVLIELDSVYAYIIYEDADNYYIDLKKPSEVYDKIIVIDPGHGGKDAGAISKSGDYEKNINLDIAMQLKELLDKEDIKVYYTRMADDKVFLKPRVNLANAVDCDYFISIHCNANTVSSPNGTEVLYYDNESKGISSKDLATLFSDEIAKTISLKQRGLVRKQGKDLYIMDHSTVPTILIEVGYITNYNDLNYLLNPDNKKAVAQGIYNGIMRAYSELPVTR